MYIIREAIDFSTSDAQFTEELCCTFHDTGGQDADSDLVETGDSQELEAVVSASGGR